MVSGAHQDGGVAESLTVLVRVAADLGSVEIAHGVHRIEREREMVPLAIARVDESPLDLVLTCGRVDPQLHIHGVSDVLQ